MGRSPKKGVEYFPLVVRFDDNVRKVRHKYGLFGVGVLVSIYQHIYGGEGYYCYFSSEEDLEDFMENAGIFCNDDVSKQFNLDFRGESKLVLQIVMYCIEKGVFDKTLHEKYGILTSHGIQSRYLEIKRDTPENRIKPEFLLSNDSTENEINRDFYGFLQKKSEKNSFYLEKPRKEKESKVKENIYLSNDRSLENSNAESEGEGQEKEESLPKQVSSVLERWNALPEPVPKRKKLGSGTVTYKMLTARLKTYGLDAVLEAIDKIPQSPFLLGRVSDFVITLDWFVKPTNFDKVSSGNYVDRKLDKAPASKQMTKEEMLQILGGAS